MEGIQSFSPKCQRSSKSGGELSDAVKKRAARRLLGLPLREQQRFLMTQSLFRPPHHPHPHLEPFPLGLRRTQLRTGSG